MSEDSTTSSAPKASGDLPQIQGIPRMTTAFQLGVWALLLIAVLMAYSNALRMSALPYGPNEAGPKFFALDNKFIILEDPRLRVDFNATDASGRRTWRDQLRNNIRLIWKQDYWWPKAVSGLYRPTTTMTYLFNYSVLNDASRGPQAQSALPYVVINVVLHFLNSVLVFYVIALLVQRTWPALLAALMWAVHPICVETVANTVGRADEFACLFAFTGFLAYFRMGRAETVGKRLLWLFACGALLLVGLSAKENTVVLIFMVLLFDFVFQPQRRLPLAIGDWIFAGAWAFIFMVWLFWIVLTWDLPPKAPLFGAFKPQDWDNAFKYASNLGLALVGLAVLAAVGVATFAVMDRVFAVEPADKPSAEVGVLKLIGRVYVVLALVCSVIGIWPLLEKLRRRKWREEHPPYWQWLVARIPAYLVLATVVLFWFSVRARLFAGMREPELPFVDNPLVKFWEDGLAGGHSVLSFVTLSAQTLFGDPVKLPNGQYWTITYALSQMIPAWLTAIKVVMRNLLLMLFPTQMSCDYSYNHIPLVNFNSAQWKQLIFPNVPPGVDVAKWDGLRLVEPVNMAWANAEAFVALGVVLGLMAIGVVAYFRFKPVCFFLLFVFLTMLPTSNLLFVMGSIQAERFLYIPSLGFCLLITLTVYGVLRKVFSMWQGGQGIERAIHSLRHSFGLPPLTQSSPQWARGLVFVWVSRALVFALCLVYLAPPVPGIFDGGMTARRSRVWENDVTLWEAAVTVCPNSFKTHKSLAYAWYERAANNFDKLRKVERRWGMEMQEIDWILDQAEKAIWVTRESQIVFVHLGAYRRIKGDILMQPPPAVAQPGAGPAPQQETLRDQEERIAAARRFYELSANVLEQGKPLDKAFNERHREYERKRGKKPEEIVDIGNYEIYWNLGIAYMRIASIDQQRLMRMAQQGAPQAEQQRLGSQITQTLLRAIDAFTWMRHLAPTNVDAHVNMGMAFWQLAGWQPSFLNDAAVHFLTALLLDQNRREIFELLDRLYNQLVPPHTELTRRPLVPVPGGRFQLNLDSPLVRDHLRLAYKQLYTLFLEVKERGGAEQVRRAAIEVYRFPGEDFPPVPPAPKPPEPNMPLRAALFSLSVLGVFLCMGLGAWLTEQSKEQQADKEISSKRE